MLVAETRLTRNHNPVFRKVHANAALSVLRRYPSSPYEDASHLDDK